MYGLICMTMLSQYLQAERIDKTEPASFHVPGIDDWVDLKKPKGQAGMLSRSNAEKQMIYPVDSEDVIEQ